MNISPNPSRRAEEEKLSQMSPFEIKNKLISMAKADSRKSTSTFLNAGRGNPNRIATEPRDAFFLLGKFGMQECRRKYEDPVGIAGIPSQEGIGKRFVAFLADNASEPWGKLLRSAFDYR